MFFTGGRLEEHKSCIGTVFYDKLTLYANAPLTRKEGYLLNTNRRKLLKAVVACLVMLALVVCFEFSGLAETSSPLEGMRIFLAGDSRSSTDYTFYKEILERKTGGVVLVKGASGCIAAYNASDEYFTRVIENEHDFSIWLVGGNDPGEAGTIGTFDAASPLAGQGEPVVPETDVSRDYAGTTFIQAVDHMMRKYQTVFAGKETAPVMIFCTDLPQQRDDVNSPWSQQANWERKRLAILECCEKNGVECLDLYTLCNFDMSQEPMFHAPTDTIHDNGVYYMDGLHPNPKGIDRITDFEIEVMEKLITDSEFGMKNSELAA